MKKLLFVLLFLGLISCDNSYNKDSVIIIKQEELFEISKEKYYVLIYLNGCLACRDCKLRINKMDKSLKEDFYYLDLELNFSLYSEEFVSNIGVNSSNNLKIKKTPTLFVILDNVISEEYIKQDNIFSFLNILEKRD